MKSIRLGIIAHVALLAGAMASSAVSVGLSTEAYQAEQRAAANRTYSVDIRTEQPDWRIQEPVPAKPATQTPPPQLVLDVQRRSRKGILALLFGSRDDFDYGRYTPKTKHRYNRRAQRRSRNGWA